jgi:hypothetical protein
VFGSHPEGRGFQLEDVGCNAPKLGCRCREVGEADAAREAHGCTHVRTKD